ncbi:MAG: choice-of-anchor Q domain-containing protein [Candidatus Sulfotelmatobacter sp.]
MTIAGGRSNRDGGAISNFGQLMINDCIIANNKAQFFGGAIASHGTIEGDRALLWINKSSIFDNEPPQGGGIECSLPSYVVRITNSTISNNRAVAGNGGGIMGSLGSIKQCELVIVNSTISGNTAGLGGGGGIYGGARISSSTISENSAANGGGISNLGVEIQNSILANDGGNCPSSPQNLTSFGYNLSSDASCPLNSAGDQNSADLVLGLLQNNGGPTATMAIILGSPAIDAGNPAGCTDDPQGGNILEVDQRGDRRPGDPKLTTGCDIGAYEYQFPK